MGPGTYSFSEVSGNALLLLPPQRARDRRPLYHISVELNRFRPASYITVIREDCVVLSLDRFLFYVFTNILY